jgi:23S rRNA (cytosine1962-C5)-methyltransferase
MKKKDLAQTPLILMPNLGQHYQLLDSGDGAKLERFGNNVVLRPDSNCVWARQQNADVWHYVDATFCKDAQGKCSWLKNKSFKEPWLFTFDQPMRDGLCDKKFQFLLRLGVSKNIGIFPEQASNWLWMMGLICGQSTAPKVLNLFGHTGVATLCAAAAGAQVCHVDASQSIVTWARSNQELNQMTGATIRWIVDDCAKFVEREIKRGVRYDALIMDPPAFGRDQKGHVFEFEKQIVHLLTLCKQVLVQDPLFVIFNGYSMGYSATVLKNLLSDFFPGKDFEYGELHITEAHNSRTLPCSLFVRFSR